MGTFFCVSLRKHYFFHQTYSLTILLFTKTSPMIPVPLQPKPPSPQVSLALLCWSCFTDDSNMLVFSIKGLEETSRGCNVTWAVKLDGQKEHLGLDTLRGPLSGGTDNSWPGWRSLQSACVQDVVRFTGKSPELGRGDRPQSCLPLLLIANEH